MRRRSVAAAQGYPFAEPAADGVADLLHARAAGTVAAGSRALGLDVEEDTLARNARRDIETSRNILIARRALDDRSSGGLRHDRSLHRHRLSGRDVGGTAFKRLHLAGDALVAARPRVVDARA